jgi:universal stress protein A
MFDPMNILVPTDFSEFSDSAIATAQDLAKKFNSKIYLLHVVDEGLQECADQYCVDPAVVEALKKESIKGAREKMQTEVVRVRAQGVEAECDIRQGAPYEEILKEQKKRNIDLIVIGSHGQTGLLKYLIGSVAERVAHAASCPVLLIKCM